MGDKRSVEQKERDLQEQLAPMVEGELLAVAPASAGGYLVQGQRFYGGLLEFMLPAMLGEENKLPLNVSLAVTGEDVYVFRRPRKGTPEQLRRWRRADLDSVQAKKIGKGMRVRWRLPSGKKAIFNLVGTSEDAQARIQRALGVSG
jgi:hypothetical protein